MIQKRVLVVDDELANRLLPGLFLRVLGHEVQECSYAQEAYGLLRSGRFTDLLLDISLPGVSGLEVCRNLRQDPGMSGLRIVAYTAHAMPEETRSFIEAGFDDLLIKPICQADIYKVFAPEAVAAR